MNEQSGINRKESKKEKEKQSERKERMANAAATRHSIANYKNHN